ncbi:hypothetical protein OROGR_015707 [Orobanche gracilis]
MSTSSARRLKERGSGGAKIAATPTGKISPVAGKSISTGKENPGPRPTSRVRSAMQKPNIRPMARIDKSAVAPVVEDPRSKWSTSSVRRGRSSSPSEFSRVLSDLRKNSSRVSLGPPQINGSCANLKGLGEKSGETSDLDKRSFNEFRRGVQENEKVKIRVLNSGISDITDGNMSSIPLKKSAIEKKLLKDNKKNAGNLEELEVSFQANENVNNKVGNGSSNEKEQNLYTDPEKKSDCENLHDKSSSDFDLKSSKVYEAVKMEASTGGVVPGSSLNESTMVIGVSNFPSVPKENPPKKYHSKLHEKLAFLEGKVKRIASDIYKTKEMLDLNNPDASKMILSDIQEKITGIEKAMVHVGRENKENTEEKEVMDSKSLVKGLSVEELEARLFPHHKLLRDRTLLKTKPGGSEIHVSTSTCNVNDEKVNSLDENDIALEFLASLNNEGYTEESKIEEMDDAMTFAAENVSLNALSSKCSIEALLMADENLDEFDNQARDPAMIIGEGLEENNTCKLSDLGCKTSTGGWFVLEGESVLLAHDDGSCSFYDIANCEKKSEYKPPSGFLPNTWQDCWIIRAPNSDGCSGRYVVAAAAGNSMGAGFCSWDFYTKDIRAFHSENETTCVRTALAPLSNNTMHEKDALSTTNENPKWWYKPCGPLITSTASCQRTVQIYDIRDGEQVMKWDLHKPVLAMEYGSPLHWRNRGKVVIAESDGISLWDVNSLSSQALLSVSSSGLEISALHVNNSDAEFGGGVRQRTSSLEAEGNDGVFCTPDSVNVLDFRNPSGIGLKIPQVGTHVQSVFSTGDNIYIGCSSLRSSGKHTYSSSQIQHISLRKQKIFSTYTLPKSEARDPHHHDLRAMTQVWGNSSLVIGVCGLGLFVFDSLKDNGLPSFAIDYGNERNVRDVIGPDNMCYPSFDYLDSRILLISKDRPAKWRYLP